MNIEGIIPFLLIIAPFAIAFLLEAIVLYYFRLLRLGPSIGMAIAINLFCLALIVFAVMPLLTNLGYGLTGLDLPIQVVVFLWWFSSVADGLLLTLFLRREAKPKIFTASILMNFLSYLFLYIFIVNSH